MSGLRRGWFVRAGRIVAGGLPVAAAACLVVALVALISAVVADPWSARAPVVEPPAIVLVSAVASHAGEAGDAAGVAGPPARDGRARGAAGPAVRDRAVLDEALARLGRQGVTHGRVVARVVVRPDLARVLVETNE